MQCQGSPVKNRLYTATSAPLNLSWTASTTSYTVTHLIGIDIWNNILQPKGYGPAPASNFRNGLMSRTPIGLIDVTDGTSNTILFGELAGRPDIYRAGKLTPGNV